MSGKAAVLRGSTGLGLAVVTAVYLLLAGAVGFRVAVHEVEISHLLDDLAARQDLNHVTNLDVNLNPSQMGKLTSFFLRISQKDIVNREHAAENQNKIVSELDHLKAESRASNGDAVLLLGITLLYLGGLRLGAGRNFPIQDRIYCLLAVSAVLFGLGISCPVLTAVVKGEHVLIGGFIIQTASKGIISTIAALTGSGNWLIAVLLAGFSIGIPLFKAVAVLTVSLSPSRERRARVGHALEAIGKWALTDVLVAAIILGIFSLNAVQENDGGVFALPRSALFFFILYCVLAGRTSYLLKASGDGRALPPAPPVGARWLNGVLVTLALGVGVGLGARTNWDAPFGAHLPDSMLTRLVPTHTELLDRRFHAQPGRATTIPLRVPFAGEVVVEVTADTGRKVTVNLEEEDKNQPIEAFRGEPAHHVVRSARVKAGKYQLVVETQDSGIVPITGFAAHLSLEP